MSAMTSAARIPYPSIAWDKRPLGSPPPVKPLNFMTRAPDRTTQEWKSHASTRAAQIALTHFAECEIWRLVEGEWVLIRPAPATTEHDNEPGENNQ